VVVVVTAAVVAVIATTIVTSANHAGNTYPQITQVVFCICVICGWIYFLASGVIFKVNFSVPRISSTVYS